MSCSVFVSTIISSPEDGRSGLGVRQTEDFLELHRVCFIQESFIET